MDLVPVRATFSANVNVTRKARAGEGRRSMVREVFRVALGYGGINSPMRRTPSRWRGPTPTARSGRRTLVDLLALPGRSWTAKSKTCG